MIETRTIRDDELEDFIRTSANGFLERPDVGKVAEAVRPLWDLSRHQAAFDGDRMCGTLRSWASELTVPGGTQVPATCISGVSVLPTHRRRGILRRFIAAEHDAARARGEAVSVLYASEYPIYGRFGYGMATQQAMISLANRQTAFLGASAAPGAIEFGVPIEDDRAAVRSVFEAWRRRQPGELQRREHSWDFDLGLRSSGWGDDDWKGFLAIHRDADGQPDGYARYSIDGRWLDGQPANILKLDELHGLSDEVTLSLWRFLADTDWVTSIVAERRSPADRLPWALTNARAVAWSGIHDALWVHLLDVPRALGARTYDGAGRSVIEVIDGKDRSRVALEVGPDGAACTRTDAKPDVSVGVAALGAAYLGGTRLRDAAIALGPGGAVEHADGALARLEGWLRTQDAPWCSTFF